MFRTMSTADAFAGFDLDLPLHPATNSAEDVATLLDGVLKIVDDFCTRHDATNADVVQALTLATALRAAMARAAADNGERTGFARSARLLDVAVQDAAVQSD